MQLDGDLSERYPLLTHCSRGRLQEHHFEGAAVKKNVKFQPLYKIENVFDVVGGVLSAVGCVCWVRNTVYDALSAYDDACARFGDEKASLFHARFALGDRLNIENSITRSFGPKSGIVERHGKMIIATQVIEQSLDLDFDFIISDLAPIDLIIQRAGRLHRHKRNQVGTRITAGADERGDSIMGIFMPEMPKEPNENWYKSILPKAAKVYPHHGQLWLTARWIIQHGEFAMPADARDMIESVYGDDAQQDIPAAFELTENRAQGADGAAISMAKFNQLNLDVGYAADMITWAQDDNAPTRLGQAMTTVRLLRCESNRIVPLLYRNKSIDWELSQVPVYTAMISAEYQANRKDIEAAKTTMPDAGRFCKAVILDQNGSVWIGKAVDGRDRVVTVRYDSKRGLSVSQGENDEFDS